jgi:hypothetical protein
MIDEKEKAVREANRQEERWQKLGGIVVDVQSLLRNLARLSPRHGSTERQRQFWERAATSAMLVSDAALAGVVSELNDECRAYFAQVPENFQP